MAIRKVVQSKKKQSKEPTNNSDYSEIQGMIKPVSELDQPMTALFYGKSGTGKTALLSTFPKKILILDIREKGTETIADEDDIDVLEIQKWSQVEQAYWLLKSGKHDYDTVGLDQISAVQNLGMEHLREEERMDPTDTFSKRNWGQLSGLIQTWLLNFRDLREDGLNVVFLAHDRVRGTEENEAEEGQLDPNVGARLMPSVGSFVNGMVSVIGNTYIREKYTKVEGKKERKVQYCLRLGPHAYYDTKIRRPKGAGPIPEYVVNPSYEKLLAISRGEDVNVKKRRK